MSDQKYISKAEQSLLDAGNNAIDLRRQLAKTYMASSEIIVAMRALRAGIPDIRALKKQLMAQANELPEPEAEEPTYIKSKSS